MNAIEKKVLGKAIFLALRILLLLCETTARRGSATVIHSLLDEARNWHDDWEEAVFPTR